MSSEDLRPFLEPTPTIESRHPVIEDFARSACVGSDGAVDRAVRLYYAVRDGIRYDPYALELSVEGLRATTTLRKGRGWCVAKAILLAAACRSLEIPVRLGFADVRNHLSTERMRKSMKTDIFFWHGYVSIHLEGRWVRATPAFITRWLLPRMQGFQAAHPDLDYEVTIGLPPTDLSQGDVDVVVHWGAEPVPGARVEPFLRSARAPVSSRGFLRAAPAIDPMKALARKIVQAGQAPGSVPLEELYATDCESYEAGSPDPSVGYEGLREKLANWGQMQEGTTFKPVNVWTGPNTVSVEWDATVKLRGGPTVNLREVAVHEIRGGKIVRERYFYNPASLAPPQAAEPPAPPSPPPASSEPPPWRGD